MVIFIHQKYIYIKILLEDKILWNWQNSLYILIELRILTITLQTSFCSCFYINYFILNFERSYLCHKAQFVYNLGFQFYMNIYYGNQSKSQIKVEFNDEGDLGFAFNYN